MVVFSMSSRFNVTEVGALSEAGLAERKKKSLESKVSPSSGSKASEVFAIFLTVTF